MKSPQILRLLRHLPHGLSLATWSINLASCMERTRWQKHTSPHAVFTVSIWPTRTLVPTLREAYAFLHNVGSRTRRQSQPFASHPADYPYGDRSGVMTSSLERSAWRFP